MIKKAIKLIEIYGSWNLQVLFIRMVILWYKIAFSISSFNLLINVNCHNNLPTNINLQWIILNFLKFKYVLYVKE